MLNIMAPVACRYDLLKMALQRCCLSLLMMVFGLCSLQSHNQSRCSNLQQASVNSFTVPHIYCHANYPSCWLLVIHPLDYTILAEHMTNAAGIKPASSQVCEDAGGKAETGKLKRGKHDCHCCPESEPDSRAGAAKQAGGLSPADNPKCSQLPIATGFCWCV